MDVKPSYLDILNEVEGVVAAFVPRVDGVEVSTDRFATVEGLMSSHREVVEQMGFNWEDCWRAEQVHGNDIAVVQAGDGATTIDNVDGLMTRSRGCVLGIYVADCGAVYILDKKQKYISVVHSGKKGTEGNIVGRTIEKMKNEWGSDPQDMVVVLAPCIRPPHYEIDFAADIRNQVLECGVPEEQYVDCQICTGSDTDCYYSYRIEKGNTGRMIALLGVVE